MGSNILDTSNESFTYVMKGSSRKSDPYDYNANKVWCFHGTCLYKFSLKMRLRANEDYCSDKTMKTSNVYLFWLKELSILLISSIGASSVERPP